MNDRYKYIINLPHYEPKHHKRMSREIRAAQFLSFAALTGFDDMIDETNASEADLSEYYSEEEFSTDETEKR
ncbi:MAG TPA: hypothetical protein DDY77_05490 [Clostridiales bacterium]|nr:hypothetical protein [Clostridiales bacterium]